MRVMLLLFVLALAAMPGPALGQTATDAMGIAKAAGEIAAPDAMAKVEEALGKVEKAREVLRGAEAKQGDAVAVDKAREDLDKAEGELDQVRVQAVAQEAGVSPAEVQALRDSGLGWGQIAKQLGVHPSTLGVGHANKKDKSAKSKKSKGKGKKK